MAAELEDEEDDGGKAGGAGDDVADVTDVAVRRVVGRQRRVNGVAILVQDRVAVLVEEKVSVRRAVFQSFQLFGRNIGRI